MPRAFQIAFLLIALLTRFTLAEPVDYNRDIRPILSNNCFYCHGPDEKERKAKLRLDTREGALIDLDGYAAIVPGKPEASELLKRIHEDPEDRMPPPKSKKVLTDAQRNLLRQWIAEGAEYAGHWAFEPLAKDEPPAVKKEAWARNGIDRFILAELEARGIAPSPEADPWTLVRRAYLDVTGLLPTPDEAGDFVSGNMSWEKLIDRLLASPHYGERWGRHWLDQARYADSNGYSVDSARQMWPYRDWVIHALNRDLPFDRFTIDQLAGDLLDQPDKQQLIATAFHRNTLINQEGGSDPEQFRVEAVIDRVNTTSAVWLGLTVGCAQCHTHKFDPITQTEFYQLYAFFNHGTDRNNTGKTISVQKGEVFGNAEYATPPKTISTEERAKLKSDWEARERKRLDTRGTPEPARWMPTTPSAARTSSNKGLEILENASLLLKPGYGLKDSIHVQAPSTVERIAAIRLRVIPHKSLPKQGPGSAGNGNFVLTGFELRVDGKPAGIASAFADHEQDGFPASAMLDGKPGTGWAINRSKKTPNIGMNAPHEAVFVLAKPVTGKHVEFRLHHQLNDNYLVGHFALDLSSGAPEQSRGEEQRLLAALKAPAAQRNDGQKKLIEQRFVTAEPRARIEKPKPDPKAAKLMIMEDGKPRETFLLTRGDFTRPAKDAGLLHPGGVGAVQPPLPPEEGRNRLDLAKWLVHPENPLTPRVTMNRMWMRYFGLGLVETEEDFGTQGSPPSHPKLLDWLGRSFIEQGWSMKQMHRLILTSATYRQASHARADLQEIDARNLLLARQSRIRLDAEIVRDAALCASGLLSRDIGGPGVHPPQPDGVYAFTQNRKGWKTSTGADRYRRGMYTMFYRSAPYPLFTTFDAPDFSSVCTRRARSNTPLQALTVANDPAFMEFAQGLALRVFDLSDPVAIETAILHALNRKPTKAERAALQKYLAEMLGDFEQDRAAAEALLSPALKQKNQPARAAALVCLARAILNTDNFITRE